MKQASLQLWQEKMTKCYIKKEEQTLFEVLLSARRTTLQTNRWPVDAGKKRLEHVKGARLRVFIYLHASYHSLLYITACIHYNLKPPTPWIQCGNNHRKRETKRRGAAHPGADFICAKQMRHHLFTFIIGLYDYVFIRSRFLLLLPCFFICQNIKCVCVCLSVCLILLYPETLHFMTQ